MALISCPECKREVSDRAPSCPGCGYPLRQGQSSAAVSAISATSERPERQPQDVLVTGPSGTPLPQVLVGEFCSFIEWILGVNDQDYVREWTVKEWSRDDTISGVLIVTCRALLEEFKDAHKETREYWRELFLLRLEDVAPPLAPMSGLMREICERARRAVRAEGFPLTREICYAELKQKCFQAGVLSGVELEASALSDDFKNQYWETVNNLPDGGVAAYVNHYLLNAYLAALWPHAAEAEQSFVKQRWGKETENDPWMQALVRASKEQATTLSDYVDRAEAILKEQQKMMEFMDMKARQKEKQSPNVVSELQAKQRERDLGAEQLRVTHGRTIEALKMWSKW